MFPVDAFRSTIRKFVSILEQFGIRYHLTGGLTTIYYGEPRLTQDIDMVVDNQQIAAILDSFLKSLESSDFIFNADVIREAIASRGMFQLLDGIESLKLDVYSRELIPGELDRSILENVFEGEKLPIASRPDAAISKLIWVSKGSQKSRRDFRKILDSSSAVDRETIEGLAGQLNLNTLFDEVIAESDEID